MLSPKALAICSSLVFVCTNIDSFINRLDPRSAGVGRKKQRAPTAGRPESASRRHRLADAFHRWRHPTIKINFSPADSIDITQRISGQKHVCLY